MKFVKILSVILVLAMLCCAIIACDSEGEGDDVDIDLPERNFYDIKVSFQIKDATGKTQIEAIDYNYKGHAEPTMLNILQTYLSVVEDWTCKIDKTNSITQIGGMKANKNNGEYWGFVNGSINLSKDQIEDDLSDGKMSETVIEDGGVFTVMLIAGEEE